MVKKTQQPIAVLDRRDEKKLKEWLKHNKQAKTVTRDLASAYAKALEEELPDIMQIADRFHLHQNLLEAVKKALNQTIPATIKIPAAFETNEHCPMENDETLKKQNVTVSLPRFTKKQQLIQQIQTFLNQGCSQREVARRMGISR